MLAAASGSKESVELLLQYGARPSETDQLGRSAFFRADSKLADILAPPHLNDLLQACGETDAVEVERLVAIPGVQLDIGDKNNNWTALMQAALFGTPASSGLLRLLSLASTALLLSFSQLLV